MKKLIVTSVLLAALFACSKVKVEAPDDFSVTVDGAARAGDTLVFSTSDTLTFRFTGNPDFITFYSGEPHKKYAFAGTTQLAADSALLYFSTNTTAAGTTTQPLGVNNVSVLASTDFSGNMDSASIRKATWTDLSSRAKFATTTTTVQSGSIRVDSLRSGDKPLYIAFRYTSDTARANYLPRKWVVASFSLKSFFADTAYALAGGASGTTLPFTSGGFYPKSLLNPSGNWVYSNTSLTFNAAAAGSLPDEDWAISRPFDLSLYPSDLGQVIKNTTVRLQEYVADKKVYYNKPGVYTATFVACNTHSENSRELVRQLLIRIHP